MPLNDTLNVLIILALPTISGLCLIWSMNKTHQLPWPLAVTLGFGLGTGLVAQWLLILSIFHLPFSFFLINLPFLVIPILLCGRILVQRRRTPPAPLIEWAKKSTNNPVDYALLSFIFIFVFFILWRAMNVPVVDWDAISTEVFRAKIFFYSQSAHYYSSTSHNTYPLHMPFVQTWFSLNLGEFHEQYVKIFYPLYSLSFVLFLYYFLRCFCSRTSSLLGVVLLLSSNFYVYHSCAAYRDITIMYYNCAAILLLVLWHCRGIRMFLILAGLFSGFSSFVKLEGTGYLLNHVLLLLIILSTMRAESNREKLRHFFFFLTPAGIICLTYHLFQYFEVILKRSVTASQMEADLYNLHVTFSNVLPRAVSIILKYVDNMFFSFNWNIVWFLLIISLFNTKTIVKQMATKLMLIAFLLYFGMYLAGFTLTKHYYWVIETNTILSRALLQIFPLACILIILINFSEEKSAS